MIGSVIRHADSHHLAGNLLLLAMCWPTVIRALGARRAGLLLATAGVVANAITAALIARPVIGLSAAAAAALAAQLALHPYGRLAAIPAGTVALAWLGSQAVLATLSPTFAGIAWPAHLIGAALGALGAHWLRRRAATPV